MSIVTAVTASGNPTTNVVIATSTKVVCDDIQKNRFTKDLSFGFADGEVTSLQDLLGRLGFLSVASTGYFGEKTRQAVMSYQLARGISAIGIVGPQTRRALISDANQTYGSNCKTILIPSYITAVTTPIVATSTAKTPVLNMNTKFTRDLTIGSEGEDVRSLQIYLNSHGFPVSISGAGSVGSETTTFGPKTAQALSRFQAANGISPAVGYFGPMTRAVVGR